MSELLEEAHATEQHTCRICHGEGTAEDPLFYPCQCRGSIKYIHQGCLEEWLKHSARREPACDICHVKYKFTTVFKEDTPDRVPLSLLFQKIRTSLLYFLKYSFQIGGLLLGCLVQIPLFWALCTRFFNWVLGAKSVHSDFLVSMIYGDNPVQGDPFELHHLLENLVSTYVSSFSTLITIIACLLFLFIVHEWVSKDPGFIKLIFKKIGQEHKSTNEWIQRAVGRIGQRQRIAVDAGQAELDRRLDENLRNLANLNRIIEQNGQNDAIADAVRLLDERREEFRERADLEQLARRLQRERLERAERHNRERMDRADRHFVNDVMQEQLRNANAAAEEADDGDITDEDPDFVPHSDDENDDDFDEEAILHHLDAHDRDDDADESDIDGNAFDNMLEDNGLIQGEGLQGQVRINLGQMLQNNNNQPFNPAQQHPVPIFPQNDEVNEDEDFELEQEDFILSLPVYLISLAANVIVVLFLALFYFFPSFVGNVLLIVICSILSFAANLGFKVLNVLKVAPFLVSIYSYYHEINPTFTETIKDDLIAPVIETFLDRFSNEIPPSDFERLIPVVLYFSIIYSIILFFLNIKSDAHSPRNPLRGPQRKIFIVLFDLVCTLKVFLIFGIELLVFPAFCGLLLEFVFTPVFTYKVKLLTSQSDMLKKFFILRLAINWGIGTLYMCLFALFVGMTRRYILRPGVLFFIRSPEDPNARLVHDALVRSLRLQLSRIGLSALVYTLFILIGFGTITHTLKSLESEMIPVNVTTSGFIFNLIIFSGSIYDKKGLITKYVRQYWSRAFKIASAKSRLSSFTLGGSNPKERGHIVYRNFFAWIRGASPDFNSPKSQQEANEIFKTTDVQACFVPDGNLVRAPKSDTVSRKFIRKLFIPVTKDDIPLKTPEEVYRRENKKYPLDEFDDSEDEITTTNHYEIVYRPPFFGARVIGFIGILWVFSVILIVGGLISCHFVGNPFVQLADISFTSAFNWISGLETTSSGDSFFSIKLRGSSIVIGTAILTRVLATYDDFFINRHLAENSQEEDTISLSQKLFFLVVELLRKVTVYIFWFLNIVLFCCWNSLVHEYSITRPFVFFWGEPDRESADFAYLLAAHTLAFVLLFIPYLNKKRIEILGVFSIGRLDINGIVTNEFIPNIRRLIIYPGIVIAYKLLISFNVFKNNFFSLNYEAIMSIVLEADPAQESVVLAYPLVLFLYFIAQTWNVISQYLKKVNAEVKEQYYSEGQTLQNADDLKDEDLGATPSPE